MLSNIFYGRLLYQCGKSLKKKIFLCIIIFQKLQLSEVCMASLLLAVIYVAFISLGLPDPLLGSAWPSMYKDFGVDISFAGIIAMIIAAGTVFSS